MEAVDSASILDEIQSIVHDKLQVVSYKWLSRSFSLSSNEAKRVLREFVELHDGELEVIYALSGWLKNKPQSYSVILARTDKLAGLHSKDPAALVSAEYVQAEELFGQSLSNGSCLWDNRYGAISNSFVKRTADVETKTAAGVSISPASNNVLKKPTEPKPLPSIGPQSSVDVLKDPKNVHNENGVQSIKPLVDSEKASVAPALRKKEQNGKSSSGTGGSLANLWGRASSKPKACFSATDAAKNISGPILGSDAQISAHEEADAVSSDDDVKDHKRRNRNGSGSRKRRVVFDYSDEEDDEAVISLASPELPKTHAVIGSKCNNDDLILEKKEMIRDEPNSDSGLVFTDSPKGPNTSKSGISFSECVQDMTAEASDKNNNEKATDSAAALPRRRKVLKTLIDDRGREVSEVVWEGVTGKNDKHITDSAITTKGVKDETDDVNKSTESRTAVAAKIPPSSANIAPPHMPAKAGNKKTSKGNAKDVKQGSITAFFKKI